MLLLLVRFHGLPMAYSIQLAWANLTDEDLGVPVGGVHVHALNHPDGSGVIDQVHVQVGGPDNLVKIIIVIFHIGMY